MRAGRRLHSYDLALQDADECVRLQDGWAKGHARRGTALAGLRRREESAQVCTRCASLLCAAALRRCSAPLLCATRAALRHAALRHCACAPALQAYARAAELDIGGKGGYAALAEEQRELAASCGGGEAEDSATGGACGAGGPAAEEKRGGVTKKERRERAEKARRDAEDAKEAKAEEAKAREAEYLAKEKVRRATLRGLPAAPRSAPPVPVSVPPRLLLHPHPSPALFRRQGAQGGQGEGAARR